MVEVVSRNMYYQTHRGVVYVLSELSWHTSTHRAHRFSLIERIEFKTYIIRAVI